MRSLHITILIFCQILLASFILYTSVFTSALPVVLQQQQPKLPLKPSPKELKDPKPQVSEVKPKVAPLVDAEQPKQVQVNQQQQVNSIQQSPQSSFSAPEAPQFKSVEQLPVAPKDAKLEDKRPAVVQQKSAAEPKSEKQANFEPRKIPQESPAVAKTLESPKSVFISPQFVAPIQKEERQPSVIKQEVYNVVPPAIPVAAPVAPVEVPKKVDPQPQSAMPVVVQEAKPVVLRSEPVAAPLVSAPAAEMTRVPAEVKPQPVEPVIKGSIVKDAVKQHASSVEVPKPVEPVKPVVVAQVPIVSLESPIKEEAMKIEHVAPVSASKVAEVESPMGFGSVFPEVNSPVVNGGLGPLHLLATTLCNYQPEKPVADEKINALYCQRAMLRKSLFEFMSLKFTNLEKLSSRLNPGLEVVPPKSVDDNKSGVVPSHGWPVVGKCTAHDLKLMAEAAWCGCEDSSCYSAGPSKASTMSTEELDKQVPTIISNKHSRSEGARYLDQAASDQSSVISKILHVADVKDAPVVESSIASLNLTQQQLATIQAHATGDTSVCKRNALRLTKALFNHLAEDQGEVSGSWPKLYNQLYEDDCARKRVIDIMNALSGFRSESTSIRRDNVEFAFAMDDLRAKVLETDVGTPLTFDRQFIEIEQFLQQSVKLMLANIDPGRAKLTSMRYRSLMPGPLSADDQCIELHQRLMSKNHPTDCNPTQFGQLPDVLRMTANSLEMWSIEKELSRHSIRMHEYPTGIPVQPKRNVNECIANLVSA